MRSLGHHLYDRNGTYYFRKFTPKGLHDLIDFKEIWLRFNTQDNNLARVYAAQLNHEFTHHIQSLHNGLIASAPEQAAGKIIQTFVQNWDQVKQRYAHKTLNQRTFNSKNAWGKDVGQPFQSLLKNI